MSLLREAERCIANQYVQNLNSFITPLPRTGSWKARVQEADQRADQGPLTWIDGRLISVKDNICTRDLPTTCGSGILDKFNSPFNATVVEQLEAAGAIIAGKTNLDEFGMGSHSVYSRFGPVKNVRNGAEGDLSAGGSSGGSAVAVAADQCYAALGTDTGGSVRLPAAYTGTVGFKPSYGLISRWGVVAYANSLDTVGILGLKTSTVRDVFTLLNHYDPHDPTSISRSSRARLSQVTSPSPLQCRPLRIGVPLEYNISELEPSVRKAWLLSLAHLQKQGHAIHPVSLPATKHALSAYYVLAPAEASSNLAKYDGVRYGTRGDHADSDKSLDAPLYSQTRGSGFGAEVKRRILLGTFSLSADAMDNYFIQAQRVRRLVQQDFNSVFGAGHPLAHENEKSSERPASGVDVLVCPTAPSPPPLLSDLTGLSANRSPLDAYVNDVFTVPASLAGLPAISVPVAVTNTGGKKSGLAGIQVVGQYGYDELVMQVGELLEGQRFADDS
ncbi:Glutamyl-tRNA(Gln) amidotransferase subunit A [Penicillium chermesinum]|uniref:Glutamyl-tRNA(Gln) amidotransferase subunit A, mitochondrial n=1 Tax=Penicillium chermesinum TaxID=63820 RepID=A0A9W9NJF9_9EURO|nr:Glutamyl-tRNA(Gln) amidotransferase subunit A [Penicillium chermesinum]KAJ5219759.1 Glutamyl-tRNA(Gln) amidotransferase subunit A [Penicillium chermesinum]